MTPECQHVSALSAEPLGDGLKTLPVSDGLHHSHAIAPSRRPRRVQYLRYFLSAVHHQADGDAESHEDADDDSGDGAA